MAATPEQASTKIDSSTAFCTRSAGSTREAVAITRSLGTARAGARPGRAAENGSRGTNTMS